MFFVVLRSSSVQLNPRFSSIPPHFTAAVGPCLMRAVEHGKHTWKSANEAAHETNQPKRTSRTITFSAPSLTLTGCYARFWRCRHDTFRGTGRCVAADDPVSVLLFSASSSDILLSTLRRELWMDTNWDCCFPFLCELFVSGAECGRGAVVSVSRALVLHSVHSVF